VEKLKKESKMKNIEMEVKGNKLHIVVDLSKEFGPSASGKTIIVGTTSGNEPVSYNGSKVMVGVNVYKK
jgi:hypothetical protein